MYNDDKIEELKKKYLELQHKRRELTSSLDKEVREVSSEIFREEQKKKDWLKHMKEVKKRMPIYMNIIFKWDNGIEFDTRKSHKLNEFKDYVFAYGLPTGFEVRG